MDYLLYFVGPFALAILGRRLLHQRYRVVGLGALGFLLSWIVIQIVVGVSARLLHLSPDAFLYGAIVAVSAGIFEELARYVIFSASPAFAGNRNARSSFMYAIGHHGMETIIVGATLALMILVVRYRPELIPDPVSLHQSQDAAAVGLARRLYHAVERLSIGLLIHVCFSGVVMLAVARHRRRWLLGAMTWHFAHDLIGANLHHLSSHWIVGKAWVLIVLVGYSYLATRIYRAFGQAEPVGSGTLAPSSPILPGRSV